MRDRVLRAYRGEPVDATPVWFMRQAGRALPEYRAVRERVSLLGITRDPALCAEVTLQPVRRLGVDAAILFADIASPLPGLGLSVDVVDGVGPVIDPPVRTPAAIARLSAAPDLEPIRPLLDALRLLRAGSPVPVVGFAGAPFTLAAYLVEGRAARDAVGARTLMAAEPAAFAGLMARLVDLVVGFLAAQVAAGAEAVQVFDSWVGALSPAAYEASVAPHDRRLFAALGRLGVPVIHFGTGTAGFLGSFAAAGGDVLGVDWRVDLGAARDAAPGRAVQGNLDPAMALAGWASAEAGARAVLAAAGGLPGHVFNLGHGVLPGTDPDVLRQIVELVHAWPLPGGGDGTPGRAPAEAAA